MLGSIGLLVGKLCRAPSSPFHAILHAVDRAVGEVAAEQTAQLLGQQGHLVLLAVDTSRFKNLQADTQRQAFLQAVKKYRALRVVATEWVDPTTIRGGADFGLDSRVFFEALARHPQAAALVSLVGAPHLTDEEMDRLPQPLPRLVAVQAMGCRADLRRWHARKLVQVEIAPRALPPSADARPPKSAREWFARYYEVLAP